MLYYAIANMARCQMGKIAGKNRGMVGFGENIRG
jgi:hypothetical protein